MENKQKSPFLYCLDTYVIRDKDCYGFCCTSGKNLISKLEIAKKAGFSGVELWHKDIQSYVSEVGDVKSLKDVLNSLELSLPSYKVMNWEDLSVLEMAAELGAESCVVKLMPDEFYGIRPPFNSMLQKYRELLEVSDSLGINPSLEFMSLAKCYNNLDIVCEILKQSEHNRASLVLDTWHLWRNDSATFDDLKIQEVNPNWISVVHFTDARKDLPRTEQRDGDRKMPGEGLLDLTGFCEKLNSIKFNGWLSLNVYDKTLWDEDPLKVASRGLYSMRRIAENNMINDLLDNHQWRNNQEYRCKGLWTKNYWTHLDPRIKESNRIGKLESILKDLLKDKVVLDFKCGFSPLSKYVKYGFDAFEDCIEYLKRKFPDNNWYCQSDKEFSNSFDEKIDVLMHIGLGDSKTEIDSHLKTREKCKPSWVIIEAAADDSWQVDETKPGSRENWKRLKEGLIGDTYLIDTDMGDRSKRIMYVGEVQ